MGETEIRLQTITLNNFRPFYGCQTIDLSTEDGKPLVLINALNDVGKTSVFKALQFCLYGDGRNSSSNVNRTAAEKGKGVTFVRLVFYHEKKHYQITRLMQFKKTSGGPVTTEKEQLEVRVDGITQDLPNISDQRCYIETILPEDASQFFFFDGEEIQKYTRHPLGEKVRESIEMVLGIRELLNSRLDVEKVAGKVSTELDSLLTIHSKKVGEAQEIKELGKTIDDMKNEIIDLDKKIEQVTQTIDDYDGALRKNKAISEKISERNELERNRDYAKNQIESIKETERIFNQNLPLILLSPCLKQISEIGKNEVPDWKKAAISAILFGYYDHCICKRPITAEIKNMFEKIVDKEFEVSPLNYLSAQVAELLNISDPSRLEDNFYDLIEERRKWESNFVEAKEGIKELNKIIEGREDIGIRLKLVEKNRKEAADQLDELTKERIGKKAQLEFMENDYKKRQNKLALEQSNEDVKNKRELLILCNGCQEAIEEAISELVNSSRNRVQELASTVFLQLTNNPDLYKGIEITDEYELMIKTVGGTTRPVWKQDPSSGQSQIIATSFIAALNRYTAREAPVIIDTPIGRLDSIHKERIINFYPNIGPQVIIFYQPNELHDEDLAPIGKYISSEWNLERDPKNPDSTIIKKF